MLQNESLGRHPGSLAASPGPFLLLHQPEGSHGWGPSPSPLKEYQVALPSTSPPDGYLTAPSLSSLSSKGAQHGSRLLEPWAFFCSQHTCGRGVTRWHSSSVGMDSLFKSTLQVGLLVTRWCARQGMTGVFSPAALTSELGLAGQPKSTWLARIASTHRGSRESGRTQPPSLSHQRSYKPKEHLCCL